MKVKPLRDKIIVELIDNSDVSGFGLEIESDWPETFKAAQIIETSDYIDDSSEVLLKGDKVVISMNNCISIKTDNNKYYIISQKNIIAVLNY